MDENKKETLTDTKDTGNRVKIYALSFYRIKRLTFPK